MTLGTPTLITASTSTTALTTITFTAQPTGALLFLTEVGDDYRTTTGTGRPESSGWTLVSPGGDQHTFEGHAAWWKLSAGDTSVSYTLGATAKSSYVLAAVTGVDQTTPLNIANGQFQQTSTISYTTPSVTPTGTGNVCALGTIGASSSLTAASTIGSWTNSYTAVGSVETTATPFLIVGLAYLNATAPTVQSTGATFGLTRQAKTGIIAVFNEAATVSANPRPLLVARQAVNRAASF